MKCLSLELSSDNSAAQATEYSPDNAMDVILDTASSSRADLDEFVILVNVVVAHLASPRFQQLLISHQAVERLLSAMVESYSRYNGPDDSILAISELEISPASQGSSPVENTKGLSLMRRGALEVLSDVSALPEFASKYPLDSPLIGSLRMWLSVPQTQLRICACLMLGNLARSDEVCWIMVHEFKVHELLIQILRESDDSQLLHAAVGFLKNLSLMADNKDAIGKAGFFEAVSRLWAMDSLPQMQYSGAGLARQAVSGSYSNIRRLLASLSPDPDSPAHSRTYLSLLLYLCKKTDQTATKIEIARTITAILRVLNSPGPPTSMAEMRETQRRLYSLHPDLARPLKVLACQDQWSVIRSEAWFTFALMAKDKVGAAAVDDVVMDSDVVRVLVEIVTGKRITGGTDSEDTYFERTGQESPAGSPGAQRRLAETKRIDRENALVLISKLLENRVSRINSSDRIESHFLFSIFREMTCLQCAKKSSKISYTERNSCIKVSDNSRPRQEVGSKPTNTHNHIKPKPLNIMVPRLLLFSHLPPLPGQHLLGNDFCKDWEGLAETLLNVAVIDGFGSHLYCSGYKNHAGGWWPVFKSPLVPEADH